MNTTIQTRRDYMTRGTRSTRHFPAVRPERVHVLRRDETMPDWFHVRFYSDGARLLTHPSNLVAVES